MIGTNYIKVSNLSVIGVDVLLKKFLIVVIDLNSLVFCFSLGVPWLIDFIEQLVAKMKNLFNKFWALVSVWAGHTGQKFEDVTEGLSESLLSGGDGNLLEVVVNLRDWFSLEVTLKETASSSENSLSFVDHLNNNLHFLSLVFILLVLLLPLVI